MFLAEKGLNWDGVRIRKNAKICQIIDDLKLIRLNFRHGENVTPKQIILAQPESHTTNDNS